MFVGITNTPRNYAWGSSTAIAELLGRAPSGEPEAELWFGAHPLSPSEIEEPAAVGGYRTLDEWIAAEPEVTLGAGRRSDRLPFLLKVLAAAEPLSIQAHPSIAQAEEGFAQEDEAGIPLEASERNYKDRLHKPELTFALSASFEALAGFRELATTRMFVHELVASSRSDEDRALISRLGEMLAGEDPLRSVVGWAFSDSDEAAAAIAALPRVSADLSMASSFSREARTIVDLGERHAGDPGIVVALLLNRVSLAQGQALYLPSGNVHAYLEGLAVEIMAASDNVLRGGLTPKHVDTEELLKVVEWESLPAPIWRAEEEGDGVEVFRPDVADFALARVRVGVLGADEGYSLSGPETARYAPEGPAIVLVVAGEAEIAGAISSRRLRRGQAAFVTPDEGEIRVTGSADVFVASPNTRVAAAS